MNVSHITITLPTVLLIVPKGKLSEFITEIVKEEVNQLNLADKKNVLEELK